MWGAFEVLSLMWVRDLSHAYFESLFICNCEFKIPLTRSLISATFLSQLFNVSVPVSSQRRRGNISHPNDSRLEAAGLTESRGVSRSLGSRPLRLCVRVCALKENIFSPLKAHQGCF